MVNSDGACADQFEQHVAVEAHPLGAVADVGAMLLHDLARAVVQHVDADLAAARAARRRWIDSSSSAETISVGLNGIFSCRNGGCSKAAEPLARLAGAAAATRPVGGQRWFGGLKGCGHGIPRAMR